MLNSALELAKITSEDPFAGIPEASQLGSTLRPARSLSRGCLLASRAPTASTTLAAPKKPRSISIPGSRTPTADRSTPPPAAKFSPTRTGFVGEYRRSYCSVAAVPIAQDEQGNMQRDYWYSVARSLAKLDSAEACRQRSRPPHHSPSRRAQSEDRACPGRSRSHGRHLHARAHF